MHTTDFDICIKNVYKAANTPYASSAPYSNSTVATRDMPSRARFQHGTIRLALAQLTPHVNLHVL